MRGVFADALSIFVLPPSMQELERRLRGRGTDDATVVARRLSAAAQEIREVARFDYVIINLHFSEALEEFQAIVMAARQRLAQVSSRERNLFADFGINPGQVFE